ncbi:hypothetical protein BCAR13_1130001 [Paraburkholderia caribensis]|nr:hypothetical protein BCAR13_1130001 [Paraburkholderia caribensis]
MLSNKYRQHEEWHPKKPEHLVKAFATARGPREYVTAHMSFPFTNGTDSYSLSIVTDVGLIFGQSMSYRSFRKILEGMDLE